MILGSLAGPFGPARYLLLIGDLENVSESLNVSLPKLPNQYYYVALSFGCAAAAVEAKAVPLRPHGRTPANCIKIMFLDCIIFFFFLSLLVNSNDIVEIPNKI